MRSAHSRPLKRPMAAIKNYRSFSKKHRLYCDDPNRRITTRSSVCSATPMSETSSGPGASCRCSIIRTRRRRKASARRRHRRRWLLSTRHTRCYQTLNYDSASIMATTRMTTRDSRVIHSRARRSVKVDSSSSNKVVASISSLLRVASIFKDFLGVSSSDNFSPGYCMAKVRL